MWIERYFGGERDEGYLPDLLYWWLSSADESQTVFGGATPGAELQVSIVSEDVDGTVCLLLDETCTAQANGSAGIGALTAREQDVLAWVADGKTNVDIAAVLEIEVATVKKHVQNIFIKLGVHTRMAAASFFTRRVTRAMRRERLRSIDNQSVQHRRVIPFLADAMANRETLPLQEHACTPGAATITTRSAGSTSVLAEPKA